MDDMLDTMYDANGIGLAIQMGVADRVIVMDIVGAAVAWCDGGRSGRSRYGRNGPALFRKSRNCLGVGRNAQYQGNCLYRFLR